MEQNYASLSLDLDNKWSYLKTLGDKRWESFPSYFDIVVPRILEYLDKKSLKISFFIVGKDAEIVDNQKYLKMIVDAGHEIGSHSYMHDPWLQTYNKNELLRDLSLADQCIQQSVGVKPIGFRGPGFSFSEDTLHVLDELGYKYDASVFPNLLNSLARIYFFSKSDLSKEEKQKRSQLFGNWRDCKRPNKPFQWNLGECNLFEIPVTTMPIIKIPTHVSYVLYLSKYSNFLARLYFNFALALYRFTNTAPSMLLHPLDFLGAEDDKDLAFFPAMDLSREHKIKMLDYVIDSLQKHYQLVSMRDHLESVESRDRFKIIDEFYA